MRYDGSNDSAEDEEEDEETARDRHVRATHMPKQCHSGPPVSSATEARPDDASLPRDAIGYDKEKALPCSPRRR
jgi:hypothetical protein